MIKKSVYNNPIREFLIKEGLYMHLTQRADTVLYPAHAEIDLAIHQEPDAYNRDALKLMLDSLLKAMANHPEHFTKDGYAPIQVIAATAFIPNHRQLLDYLVMRGVLDRAEVAVGEGGLEYAYRLSPAHQTTKRKEERLESAAVIEAAISTCLHNMAGAVEFPELLRYYADGGLTIDTPMAIQALENHYQPLIVTGKHLSSKQIEGLNRGLCKIHELKNRQFFFKYDTASGYLYTSLSDFTFYPELQAAVTYKGKHLINLEVLDSKFIMLIALMSYEFWGFAPNFQKFLYFLAAPLQRTKTQAKGSAATDEELTMSFNDYIERVGLEAYTEPMQATPPNGSHMSSLSEIKGSEVFLNTLYATPVTPLQARRLISLFSLGKAKAEHTDITRFKEIVSRLGMLDYLVSSIRFDDLKERMQDSEEYHYMLPNMLFDKAYTRGDGNIVTRSTFYSKFPTMATFLEWINQKDEELLSKLLNKMESHVLLERICRRIIAEDATIPVFPLMDVTPSYSILTTSDAKIKVRSVMAQEMGRIGGYNLFIASHPWNEEDTDEEHNY